jgi:hypothetical protein
MPASTQTLVDSVISISAGVPATQDAAGFAALTFTAIGQITSWTPGGRLHTMTSSNPIAQRGTDFYKATYNNGTDSITVNRDDDDAGQVIALSAEASDAPFSYKVAYQDNSFDYFQGKTASFITGAGDANALVTATLSVQRISNTITTAPV